MTRDRIAALLRGRSGEAAVQAGKAGVAAVLALLAARALGEGPLFLAPYAAVLAVTATVRRSWSGAARQGAMVVAGVVLAFAVGLAGPPLPVALGIVVVAGLLLGRWRRFADDQQWIAVTALLLTANGTAGHPTDLATWVLLSLAGSAIGATVNTLVLPPLHLRDAHDAVDGLADDIAGIVTAMAAGVRSGWSAADAAGWVSSARHLRSRARRVEETVWFGRESARWNLRMRHPRRPAAPLAAPAAVEQTERLVERIVQIAVLLGDLADLGDQPADPTLADVLDQLAATMTAAVARFDAPEERDELVAAPAEQVRQARADGCTTGKHLRSACITTVSDALTDLHHDSRTP
ncbi:FUSC family protein [Pseudonocardia sp. CA-107938]|uniref:FUSC family protein n=1 Tax=Pseudonocardia sp. CA-107938 TaxID=3240021 RepID=UPI003D8E99AF